MGSSFDFRSVHTDFIVARPHPFGIVLLILCLIPFWPLFRKAGFSGALSLLMLVPGINLIVLYIVAFSRRRVAR